MWIVARHISEHAGGDPGFPGLYGGPTPPAPHKPARLIRLDMAGWPVTDDATKAAFESCIDGLVRAGVQIVTRKDDPAIEAYEQELARMPELWRSLYRFEMRWPLYQYRDYDKSKLPPRLLRGLEEGAGLTQAEYRAALVKREHVRAMHADLAHRVDGFVTLSSPGPGPIGVDQGSAIFNEASSVLGAPAISLPFLTVESVPVGVQILGPWHGDERLTACARWLTRHQLGYDA
jgi:Asp-tRNA(Asn)/Glu-tRNA(Gln) amidotransferase A subunit family amidase